ncbi:hypothetical protein KR222_010443, partial [Zaprionus bogoriensis]
NHRACFHLQLLVILLASLAPVAPATFVPRIDNGNGFQLEPENDQYSLRIRHPDGTSVREEIVKETAPGELEVKGTLHQLFPDRGGTLVVTYEAGPNGYVAKYKYTGAGKPVRPMYVIFLTPKLLMTAAG